MKIDVVPEGWRSLVASDIAASTKGAIVSGPFGSNIGRRFFVESGIPVIRGNNLSLGSSRFVDSGFVFVTEQKALELRGCEATRGDLIFTAAGTLGQVGIVPDDSAFERYIISNKQLRLRVNRTFVDSLYCYYWFSQPAMRRHIEQSNRGASVPLITLGVLRSLPILVPPLRAQRRIASILGAYDDLIEVNRRRIAVLEEMARRLFEEWFVHFRFPGHENVPLDSSQAGPLPKGWELVPFEALLESWRGGDWGAETATCSETEPVFVVRGTDIDDLSQGSGNRVPARFIDVKSLEKRQLRPMDLIVENSINAKSRCAGKTLLVTPGLLKRLGGNAIAASFCKVFRFHDPRLAPIAHQHMKRLIETGDMALVSVQPPHLDRQA